MILNHCSIWNIFERFGLHFIHALYCFIVWVYLLNKKVNAAIFSDVSWFIIQRVTWCRHYTWYILHTGYDMIASRVNDNIVTYDSPFLFRFTISISLMDLDFGNNQGPVCPLPITRNESFLLHFLTTNCPSVKSVADRVIWQHGLWPASTQAMGVLSHAISHIFSKCWPVINENLRLLPQTHLIMG